jgi:hypothetical protein
MLELAKNTNVSRITAKIIFSSDSRLMPLSSPRKTENDASALTKTIKIIWV